MTSRDPKRQTRDPNMLRSQYLINSLRCRTWWCQNEWLWQLFRGRLRSCQPLCHIRHWISWKPLEIEAWFQSMTNRKWPMGNQMVTWLTASR